LELRIMQVLWRLGGSTVSAVQAELEPPLAYTTAADERGCGYGKQREPAYYNGHPVAVQIDVEVNFKLC